MNVTEQAEKAFELGLATSVLLLDLVQGLDADLRKYPLPPEARIRLRAIVALVAPALIE